MLSIFIRLDKYLNVNFRPDNAYNDRDYKDLSYAIYRLYDK